MIWLQFSTVALAFVTLAVYAQRVNAVSFRTHRARCVLAQLAGGGAACAVFGQAFLLEPHELVLCGVVLAGCWLHILGTADEWRAGAPARESRQMPDNAEHA